MAASVKARLLNLRAETGRPFDQLLSAYVLERVLFRLSASEHRDRFVLKGAVLFSVWFDSPHRATRDLDLLGYGLSSPDSVAQTFREICATSVAPDGLTFAPDTLAAEPIGDAFLRLGVRVTCVAQLGRARCPVQVDVGFGDAVTPAPELVELKTLLGDPAPRVRAYRPETVVAEKVEAMITLGIANSRSKDFFDAWTLARRLSFDGQRLVNALRATLEHRGVHLPDALPLALTDAFATDEQQRIRWAAFVRKAGAAEVPADLGVVIAALREFLASPLQAVRGRTQPPGCWPPGGPWASGDVQG